MRQPVSDEGAEGFVELALGFSGDGVEHQRRFPRTGHARKDGEFLFGNLYGDTLKIMLTGAAHANHIITLLAGHSNPWTGSRTMQFPHHVASSLQEVAEV